MKADINKNKGVELKGIRNRIAMVKIATDKRSLICVQVYTTTSKTTERELDEFSDNLGNK